jgi:hypothetical protein
LRSYKELRIGLKIPVSTVRFCVSAPEKVKFLRGLGENVKPSFFALPFVCTR